MLMCSVVQWSTVIRHKLSSGINLMLSGINLKC